MVQPVDWSNDIYSAIEEYHKRGWTDGLPVVPPTEKLVEAFLLAGGTSENETVISIPERRRTVTAGHVALNAIMAGCLPSYMPVLLAALEAIADPDYNVHASAASTGGAAPFMVVNGPVRTELEMNSGENVFGPGNRANATVGRALRLILINCIGAVPGLLDRSTQGHPGKYSFTIAENEEASPWEPLHVENGFHAEQSTVTLLASLGPYAIRLPFGDATGILEALSLTMSSLGSMSPGQSFFILAPGHAEPLARKFSNKKEIKASIFERAGLPVELLLRAGKLDGPAWGDDPLQVRHGLGPEDIHIVVAGGLAGRNSSWIPSWSVGRNCLAVTRPVISAFERRKRSAPAKQKSEERV